MDLTVVSEMFGKLAELHICIEFEGPFLTAKNLPYGVHNLSYLFSCFD